MDLREIDKRIAVEVMGARWSTKKLDWGNLGPYKCSKCGGSDYYLSAKHKRRICKPCNKNRNEKWKTVNPKKQKEMSLRYSRSPAGRENHRSNCLKHRYGITLAEFKRMFEGQNGLCLICKSNRSKKRDLVVDHCHSTGKVRGLLCDPCNQGLGMFRDNLEFLKGAFNYLAALKAIES